MKIKVEIELPILPNFAVVKGGSVHQTTSIPLSQLEPDDFEEYIRLWEEAMRDKYKKGKEVKNG